MLNIDKGRKHANDQTGRHHHDEHPEVELHGRPVVFVHALDDAALLVDERAACYGRGHGGG